MVVSTRAGLKAAVACGGMICDTVVDARTELALDVTMVWARPRPARRRVATIDGDSMVEMMTAASDGESESIATTVEADYRLSTLARV